MEYEKKKLLILLASSLFILGGIFYVFKQPPKNTVEKESEKEPEQVTIRVNIKIVDDNSKEVNHSAKLSENSTLLDFLENLRKNDKIKYDLTNYTYGQVLESVNGLENNKEVGDSWRIYVNGTLTNKSPKEITLTKNSLYTLRYEQSE